MEEQKKLAKRIDYLCQMQGISYYRLSYLSAVPMTTLMHIIDCSTKNPGVFTIMKICNGLNMTVKDFVVIPFNQPDEEEIPPESDAPAGQGQSRGGRSGRKTRPDRIGGIFWAGHDRCPG